MDFRFGWSFKRRIRTMAKNISRKDFLKGAAMSAAGVGLFASG